MVKNIGGTKFTLCHDPEFKRVVKKEKHNTLSLTFFSYEDAVLLSRSTTAPSWLEM